MRTIRCVLRTFVVASLGLAGPLAQAAAVLATQPATPGQLAQGAYFGVLLLVLAASIGQALPDRNRNFGAFALYLVLLGVAQGISLGLAGIYLWPGDPDWDALTRRVAPGVAVAAALWLVQVLTEPARFSRALDLACWSFIAALLSAVAVHAHVDTHASDGLVDRLAAGALVVAAAQLALAWRRGRDPAIGWIVLGFVPAGAMAVFPLAQRLDWVGESALTEYGLVVGTTLQLPILYHALVRRASRRRETGVRASELHHSDALTGLDDRRTLIQRLDDALARSRDLRHQCAVLLVRLTNHPELAEDLGRETANRALVVTASILRQCATDIDLAARVGEHDFALLMEGPTTGEASLARAQQIVARGLQDAKALPRSTTLRFHVAVALLPDHELNARRCLKWLDEACEAMRADPRKAIRAINF